MEIEKQNKKYIDYSFDDFLNDDFFIKSILRPTEESVLFWNKHLINNKNYEKAVTCIKDLNKDLLEEENINTIWHLIQADTNHRKRKSRRLFFITSSAIAACLALLFYISFQPTKKNINPNDVINFAHSNIPNIETTETQLFVSDNKIISVKEKESIILYDSASIKVTSQETVKQEISMNEIADFNQLIVPKGKRSFLTLVDGTQIWVNSGTRLVYPSVFTNDKREIFIDGEIFIEVKSDNNKPFIVKTNDMDISVLGTKFNVQAYQLDGQKRVVLQSGSVKISSKKSQGDIILKPTEMYEAIGEKIIIKPINVNNYISWKDGIYIFDSERLDEILTRLSRYYGKEITVDKKAAELKCNGKLDLKENLNDVLNILQYIVPIDYKRENDIFSITYKP